MADAKKNETADLPDPEVLLHPAMTLEQVAAWCAHHKRIVTVSWDLVDNRLVPRIRAVPDSSPSSELLDYMRRQGGL